MRFLEGLPQVARQLILSFSLFVASVLVAHAVRLVMRRVLTPLARRTRTELDSMLLEQMASPVSFLIMAAGLSAAVNRLLSVEYLGDLSSVRAAVEVAYVAVVAAVTLLISVVLRTLCGWYLRDIASRTQTTLDRDFVPLFGRLTNIIIYFIGATVVLAHFKVNLGGFLATAGVASLAVALAAQETVANAISGFLLILDRPFRIDDWVQLESGESGIVHEIGLRSTKILTFDNTMIILPNAQLARSRLVNRNYPDLRIKVRREIGVAYGTDLEKAKRLLLAIFAAHPGILKDPEPGVFFTDFGDSALKLLAIYWVGDLRNQFRISDEVNMEIKARFEAEHIEIPFPQRDVHLRRE